MTIHKTSKAEKVHAYHVSVTETFISIQGPVGSSLLLGSEQDLGKYSLRVPGDCLTTALWVTSAAAETHISHEKKEKNW